MELTASEHPESEEKEVWRYNTDTCKWNEVRSMEGELLATIKELKDRNKKLEATVTRLHGYGEMEYENGDKYDGEWKDGKHHGLGTMTYADGREYTGMWKDGIHHGLMGIMTYADGSIYNGKWKDGKRHGWGRMTYQNGDKYRGEWKDGIYTMAGGGFYGVQVSRATTEDRDEV